jgi:hypothetical protein
VRQRSYNPTRARFRIQVDGAAPDQRVSKGDGKVLLGDLGEGPDGTALLRGQPTVPLAGPSRRPAPASGSSGVASGSGGADLPPALSPLVRWRRSNSTTCAPVSPWRPLPGSITLTPPSSMPPVTVRVAPARSAACSAPSTATLRDRRSPSKGRRTWNGPRRPRGHGWRRWRRSCTDDDPRVGYVL